MVKKIEENKIYCVNCDEEMHLTNLKNYEFEEGLVLKNVLSYKCQKCREIFFTEEQAKNMEIMTNNVKEQSFGFERKIAISGKSLVMSIPIELAKHLSIKQGTEVKILPISKQGFIVKKI